jgi:hypothetical protein
MLDPPLNRHNKRQRSSNESTSAKKPDDTALAPPTETRNKKLKRIKKLAPSSTSESLSFSETETMIDKKHTSKKSSSSVKYSPPSKRAKRALDFTVLPESSSPMSEPTTSKRATDPQDEDYRALKRTKFMSEPPPSTPKASTLPNLKRSFEAEDDYAPKRAKLMSKSPQSEPRDFEEHRAPKHSKFRSESPLLVPKSSTSQNLTQERRTRMEKNRQAAEEIRKRTKSTLIPVIELLALDSTLKGSNPGVELKSKEVSAITPEQRQRMKANHDRLF